MTHELKIANETIHSYEESICKLQTLEATKDQALVERLQEVAELQASLVKEKSAKEVAAQTLSEETIRLQSQLEAVTEENNRLRNALDSRRVNLESTQMLIQEGEAKIEHWKVGLENSYQQKRILKQSMRQLMEEDASLRERLLKERRERQALERDLMHREDLGSVENTQNEEDQVSAEFGNLDWARRVYLFRTVIPSCLDILLETRTNGTNITKKFLRCQKKQPFRSSKTRSTIWNGRTPSGDCFSTGWTSSPTEACCRTRITSCMLCRSRALRSM